MGGEPPHSGRLIAGGLVCFGSKFDMGVGSYIAQSCNGFTTKGLRERLGFMRLGVQLPRSINLVGAKMANSFSRISSMGQRDPQVKVSGSNFLRHSETERNDEVLIENVFHSMLTLERRRAERSRKPFVLMLLDANLENGTAEAILKQAVNVVVASKRETDLVGWYKQGAILGIIFTEISQDGEVPITETL